MFLHLPFQVQEDLPEEMGKKIFLFKSDKDVEKLGIKFMIR